MIQNCRCTRWIGICKYSGKFESCSMKMSDVFDLKACTQSIQDYVDIQHALPHLPSCCWLDGSYGITMIIWAIRGFVRTDWTMPEESFKIQSRGVLCTACWDSQVATTFGNRCAARVNVELEKSLSKPCWEHSASPCCDGETDRCHGLVSFAYLMDL